MNISRILKSVIVNDEGCWIWQKSCNSAGYGQLTENKVYWLTHRYAYACNDPSLAPEDLVRHQCHIRNCCNPAHLLKGTHKDNWNDSIEKHTAATTQRRKQWEIEGVVYPTIRDARKETGISMQSLINFTSNDVFDSEGYRAACRVAGWNPKI